MRTWKLGILLALILVVSGCGKRGTLRPEEREEIPFPRRYPAPLTEEELNPADPHPQPGTPQK
ncbi:MAG: hypothetical protein LBJ70_05255 [Holosporales bacterium]|jgi:hypothetical protein|nr:hypothetical protein [Holosporales bacterium]